MTLWPCPVCGKQAPTSSITCPHCGGIFALRRESVSYGAAVPGATRVYRPLVAVFVLVLALGLYSWTRREHVPTRAAPAQEPVDAEGRPLIYFESLTMERVRQAGAVERALAEGPRITPLAGARSPAPDFNVHRTGSTTLDSIWAIDEAAATRRAGQPGMRDAIIAAGLTSLQYEVIAGRIALAAVKWSYAERRRRMGGPSDTSRAMVYPSTDDDIGFFAQHRAEIVRVFPLTGSDVR
ncbi:MAG: zinc ribbon domain-containing protein [Gemmatimonadaceae bacterium]